MAGRFSAWIIVVSWVLAPQTLTAQSAPPFGAGPAQYGLEPAAFPPPSGYDQPVIHAGGAMSGCPCPSCSAGGAAGPDGSGGPAYGYGGAQHHIYSWPEVHEQHDKHPVERFLHSALGNGSVRLEWLGYDILQPGGELLGTQALTVNTSQPFVVQDPITAVVQGAGEALTTSDIRFHDTDGMRLVIDLPLREGELQFRGFFMEQASDVVLGNIPEVQTPGSGFFTVVPTTLDGQRTDDVFLIFDDFYSARMINEVWGTDLKFLYKVSPPHPGLQIDPIVNARFLYIHEDLSQTGVFDGSGTFGFQQVNPRTMLFDSESTNYLYGAGAGLHIKFVHPWFTIGIEPRVDLALNTYRNRVTAENMTTFGDNSSGTDKDTIFAPVAEVGAYVKMRVNPNFSVWAGYNFIWASRVTRAHENIQYDLLSNPLRSNITVDTERQDLNLHGITLGGEWRFR